MTRCSKQASASRCIVRWCRIGPVATAPTSQRDASVLSAEAANRHQCEATPAEPGSSHVGAAQRAVRSSIFGLSAIAPQHSSPGPSLRQCADPAVIAPSSQPVTPTPPMQQVDTTPCQASSSTSPGKSAKHPRASSWQPEALHLRSACPPTQASVKKASAQPRRTLKARGKRRSKREAVSPHDASAHAAHAEPLASASAEQVTPAHATVPGPGAHALAQAGMLSQPDTPPKHPRLSKRDLLPPAQTVDASTGRGCRKRRAPQAWWVSEAPALSSGESSASTEADATMSPPALVRTRAAPQGSGLPAQAAGQLFEGQIRPAHQDETARSGKHATRTPARHSARHDEEQQGNEGEGNQQGSAIAKRQKPNNSRERPSSQPQSVRWRGMQELNSLLAPSTIRWSSQ